ncbi:MAG: DNA-binding CsgD family transcriptional regulator/PAS domain-containing protein [Paracoccaceae bacterium]|jgi:DNA-binding CsgD family transcriptional regulator/PAS domain-containing protein
MQIDPHVSELLASIYEGPLEAEPWQSFLVKLRQIMGANSATLVLKPPSTRDRGVLCIDGGRMEGIARYQESLFAMDPFLHIPPGQVKCLLELVPEAEWVESELYKVCMEPAGFYDCLGVDMYVPEEMEAGLRVTRGKESARFNDDDKALMRDIVAHLERAIRLHVRFNKIESERALYAGAVNQLSLATILLDENGAVLSCNRMAEQLLAREPELQVSNGYLQLGDDVTTAELQRLIAIVLEQQQHGGPAVIEAMRITRDGDYADLGVAVRPVPMNEWSEGRSVPTVAIFISDPDFGAEAPVKVISRLFGFTPTEAQLALLLAEGLSLDEASQALGISRNTARTHLRSIFNKTGVSRQTLLVRLILKSVAQLAWEGG